MKSFIQLKVLPFFKRKIVYHVLFWCVIFTLGATDLYNLLFNLVPLLIPIYINLLVLIPRFFKTKKWGLYLLFFILLIALFWLFMEIVLPSPTLNALCSTINSAGQQTINAVFGIILTFGIKYIKDGIQQQRETERLQKLKLETELNLLKSQLNPHFLFNTLNNFYGLAIIKSDVLPDLMLKLSDLLRYMLYETNEHKVPFKNEIQYIKNYIALEKIRLSNKIDIALEIDGDYEQLVIFPMLFIGFIENAFKHLDGEPNQKKFIYIHFRVVNNNLAFHIENSYLNTIIKNKHGGIGLENIKKRLTVFYKNNYSLNIHSTNTVFSVDLTLDLI